MKRNMILAALAAATVLGVIGCCGTKDVKVETIKKMRRMLSWREEGTP